MADGDLTTTSIPDTLKKRLRAGRVIPFVGAGVSMSVKDKETNEPLFPGWRRLLESAAARLERDKKDSHAGLVRNFLAPDISDYLEAAKRAREGMGAAIWVEFLKEQLDKLSEQASVESLALAQAIWQLGSKLIITTNFDRVLEWASPQPVDTVSWDIEARGNMAAMLREGVRRPTVWHLHGQIHNASELILTPEGYALLYPDTKADNAPSKYEAALQTLRSLLSTHTFLFIGFSLDDVYFRQQLEKINDIYGKGTGPHYALMREADTSKGLGREESVKVVPFPDFGEPLLQLVRELGAIAAKTETLVELQSESPPSEPSAPRVADYDPRHRVFFVPYRAKGSQVIGRDAALQAVRQQLTSGRPTAIGQTASFSGLGGLGKTQLAVEYAYTYGDTYPNGVIWLNADQDIDAQLTELAEKARWVAPASEHKYKLEIALRRLRTYSDCLIIFDNLEDPQAIENYLPEPEADPHILVTSRTDQPGFVPIELDPLNEALSVELLIQEAGRKPLGDAEEEAARKIADALGGLPLALELAGAFLQYRKVTWQQYYSLLEQSLKDATSVKPIGGGFTKHETDLYSTLKINEQVFAEEPRLRDILDLLTWSGSSSMGISLMCALLDVKNPAELTGALGLGALLRLLQKTPDAESYSIHRLVGEVRREEIPLQDRREWVDVVCQRVGDWFQERREEFTDLPDYEAEIDHLRAWQAHAEAYAFKHVPRLIWLQAYPPYHRGHYGDAKRLVETALQSLSEEQQIDNALKAHLLNDLSYCYYRIDEPELTLEYAKKALTLRLELFDEKHTDTATSFDNISHTYRALKNYNEALEYAQKALIIRQELFGEKHPDTARSYSGMASVYRDSGDYIQALEYGKKSLAVLLELYGETHPDTARAMNNIGITYSRLKDHKRAFEYKDKALKLAKELLGNQHPSTVRAASNLAITLNDLGRHLQAFHLLDTLLNNLPSNHPEYGWIKDTRQETKKRVRGLRQESEKPKGKRRKKKRR